ncbi:MAG: hypothetical protein M3Q15_04280, partial [Pseudomonadota bacterium]|nr:hypothetical protein [Pseudomonadota bacterium]
MDWLADNLPPALMVAFFGLLMLALARLAHIQVSEIAHSRGISRAEARQIYKRDYNDGESTDFRWGDMRRYCEAQGIGGTLSAWTGMIWVALAGIGLSIWLDML